MLPRGMSSERPWARFRVKIYKAEGLPTMESGLMGKMSKVTDRTVFIDPYVQVTFAGQQVNRCVNWHVNFQQKDPKTMIAPGAKKSTCCFNLGSRSTG